MVADSLPDKFGNKIIDRWLAEQGKSISEFNVIDRLCYTGKRGMGALEYIPATSPFDSTIEDVNISKMVEFASDVLSPYAPESVNIDVFCPKFVSNRGSWSAVLVILCTISCCVVCFRPWSLFNRSVAPSAFRRLKATS